MLKSSLLLLAGAAFVTYSCFFGSAAFAEGERGRLETGKWLGFIQPDGATDAIAVTLDAYLIQPDNVIDFPQMELLLKMSLGGYASTEYETEIYENPQYDFNFGNLTLDEPENELVIRAKVYANPTRIEGRVDLRSAPVSGRLYLKYLTDEPGDDDDVEIPPFRPTLAGQYEGKCGDQTAVLQLETGRRGIASDDPAVRTSLKHYDVTGTLGTESGLCSRVNGESRPVWCIDHAFSSATFDYFEDSLVLLGRLESDECEREGNDLVCDMQMLPPGGQSGPLVEETCRFSKATERSTDFRAYPRRFRLRPTPEQREPLPPPAPPGSPDLVEAANGTFTGYLHHETTDRYQPLQLRVLTSISTVNPHNENDVFVSVSSSLFFGGGISSEYWTQQFDRNPLWVLPGYTLQSEESDTFLQVTEWTKGYIAGTWYSHQFGKVGTFQVIKGSTLPTAPAETKFVQRMKGRFQGPDELNSSGGDYWDVKVLVPPQLRAPEKSFLEFEGNFRLNAGGVAWPVRRVSGGAYDFYTGAVTWIPEEAGRGERRLVTGTMDDTGHLKMFWPNERILPVSVFDRSHGTLRRVAQ